MDIPDHPAPAPHPLIRKPRWLRVKLGGEGSYAHVSDALHSHGLHTICASGRCPNQGECWASGTASFLLLGDICTRQCRFCATKTGVPLPPDPREPHRLADTVRAMRLRHAVITAVDRDDLADGGAAHWAEAIGAVQALRPRVSVEVLLPDFMGKAGALERVLATRPQIVAHNLETVERLTPSVRSRARYGYSLGVIARMAESGLPTKSGLMLGLGERQEEVLAALRDLRGAGCGILTLGQYLQPTRRHAPVMRYYSPEAFEELGEAARAMGFRHVESGPLVRSSFHAEEALRACGLDIANAEASDG